MNRRSKFSLWLVALIGRPVPLSELGNPSIDRFRPTLEQMIPHTPDQMISKLVSDLRAGSRAEQEESLWQFVSEGY